MKQEISEVKQGVSGMKQEISVMKQDIRELMVMKSVVLATQEHVVSIDERLTQMQSIKKLYSEEALEAVGAI
jgi:hypothetical protein